MISLDSLIALLNLDEEAETEATEKKDNKLIWLIIALIILYLLTRKR